MIEFHYELDFDLGNETYYADWLNRVALSEGGIVKQIDYIFCRDEYLLDINQKYLNHDTYTDIISFDYSEGKVLSGDIFISIERVRENADAFGVDFAEELLRVMSHGVLHLSGFKDKTEEDSLVMRGKEDEKIKMFHVEQ